MNRVAIRATLLLLAATLVGPSAAATSPGWDARIVSQVCRIGSGGDHGKGYMEVRVRAEERGRSGVRKFSVFAEWQRARSFNWPYWATAYQGWETAYRASGKFSNDSADHYFDTTVRFSFDKIAQYNRWGNKIGIEVEFWRKRLLGAYYIHSTVELATDMCTTVDP